MGKLFLMLLFVACATPDISCPEPVCRPCATCPTVCTECVSVCGDAGVKRCELGSSRTCECKGY